MNLRLMALGFAVILTCHLSGITWYPTERSFILTLLLSFASEMSSGISDPFGGVRYM